MNEFKYFVNGNRIVVRPAATEGKTESGLFIPETAQGPGLKWGVVVAIPAGAGYYSGGNWVKTEVRPGDRVLFDELGTTKVRLDGDDLLFVRNEDVALIDRSR